MSEKYRLIHLRMTEYIKFPDNKTGKEQFQSHSAIFYAFNLVFRKPLLCISKPVSIATPWDILPKQTARTGPLQ